MPKKFKFKPLKIKPIKIKPLKPLKPLNIKRAAAATAATIGSAAALGTNFDDETKKSGIYDPNLGTSYPYSKYIRNPKELGVSAKGDLTALGNDITALIAYAEVLTTGTGKGSTTKKPLGNKFFYPTNSKCVDISTNTNVDRHVYFSNVPTGNIPLLSDSLGGNFKSLKGLVPGMISNTSRLSIPNPADIFQSFTTGGGIKCQKLTLEVIDINNNKASESKYVALTDISKMDPCLFPSRSNPLTSKRCSEMFENYNTDDDDDDDDDDVIRKSSVLNKQTKEMNEINLYKIPDDLLIQLYFLCIGLLIIYILMKILFSKR